MPVVVDTNPNPHIVETTLTAEYATVDIGNGVMAHAETFNGAIPGADFELNVGDTVIVHFQNHLSVGTGIHWHGIELPNEMDGTPFTQNLVPPGGSFLYYFKVLRPGIFWYHPHHDPADDTNTNQVFSGLSGMIIVRDPNEAALQASGTLPPPDQTKPIVLSDTTVCKAPGTNDTVTYLNPGVTRCHGSGTRGRSDAGVAGAGEPHAEDAVRDANRGRRRRKPPNHRYAAGDIPSIQPDRRRQGERGPDRADERQERRRPCRQPGRPGCACAWRVHAGRASRPGPAPRAGQYVGDPLLPPASHRSTGANIPLIRVGGEGGLLDNAVEEGGTQGTWVTGYDSGEIVLAPGSRADVVAAIPASATGVMTMWTEDYQRTGLGFADIPTVPVMHLNVTGSPVSPAYTISAGTPLRAATGDPVPVLGPPTGTLLNPATFSPAKLGSANQNIKFTVGPTAGTIGVDNITASHDAPNYETAPHLGSTRYAKPGDTLELSLTNTTQAHHPFHLHGFSIQPLSLSNGTQTFTWPYPEFRDNVDIPGGFTLTFRVRIDPRPQADGTTPGGELGRWLFHCHIFFHATLGMLSELVVVPPTARSAPTSTRTRPR